MLYKLLSALVEQLAAALRAYLLLLGLCGEVLGGLVVRNTATDQLRLADPCRRQHGGRILVLGLDGIWHLSSRVVFRNILLCSS